MSPELVQKVLLASVPFVGVLVGLVYRTFVPFMIERYKVAQETGEWPKFDKKFWVPPGATLVIESLILAGALFASPGALDSVSGMTFVTAIAFGMAGQGMVRDIQKWLEARKKD